MTTFKFGLLAGQEAALDPSEGGWVLTVCGATLLRSATLAAQMRRRVLERRGGRPPTTSPTTVWTCFGQTLVELPTIADELVDMWQLRECGLAGEGELAEVAHEILGYHGERGPAFVSIFARASVRRPTPRQETLALAAALDGGLLPDSFRPLVTRCEHATLDGRALALKLVVRELRTVDPYRDASVDLHAILGPRPARTGTDPAALPAASARPEPT